MSVFFLITAKHDMFSSYTFSIQSSEYFQTQELRQYLSQSAIHTWSLIV